MELCRHQFDAAIELLVNSIESVIYLCPTKRLFTSAISHRHIVSSGAIGWMEGYADVMARSILVMCHFYNALLYYMLWSYVSIKLNSEAVWLANTNGWCSISRLFALPSHPQIEVKPFGWYYISAKLCTFLRSAYVFMANHP